MVIGFADKKVRYFNIPADTLSAIRYGFCNSPRPLAQGGGPGSTLARGSGKTNDHPSRVAKLIDHAVSWCLEWSAWGGSWGGSGDADQLIQVDLNLDHRNKFCIRKYAEQNETTRRVFATRTERAARRLDTASQQLFAPRRADQITPDPKQSERLLFALFTKPT